MTQITRQSDILERLSVFVPIYLEVINESHQHSGPKNAETHFKVTLVSEQFVGLNRVARHQQVYQKLQPLMAEGLHALALHLYTVDEWSGKAPDSPLCRGAEK
jgi:BolA protein